MQNVSFFLKKTISTKANASVCMKRWTTKDPVQNLGLGEECIWNAKIWHLLPTGSNQLCRHAPHPESHNQSAMLQQQRSGLAATATRYVSLPSLSTTLLVMGWFSWFPMALWTVGRTGDFLG